ncbi:YcgN family cysteine cluster protein [Hahella ganghwensis]|uniref:YcgN family cysteine cluster protein n=1 Tax=Hahella ganghwensis TaxID=286420 RepID=UPI0003616B61|nr:YcgN family cysteine cluster protein [Hahella ganghwensis]
MSDKRVERWWQLPLDKLSPVQWEQLCDGCGKCCLHKLQDEDTEELYFTAVACRFLDTEAVRCTCYQDRAVKNQDCLVIKPDNIESMLDWLPQTCAYRLRYEGQSLPAWHPLISGDALQIVRCGHSVKHRVISEERLEPDADWEELILLDIL